ncbi:hypothetical protein ACX40Y_00200 [Sphingomonas sp. RS6]
MTTLKDKLSRLGRGPALGAGAAILLALGAAGGASAVSLTRPAIEMAPLNATPIGTLTDSGDVVTIKGKVAEIFGDRIVVQDQTGKAMVDVGRASDLGLAVGQDLTVQGRYDDGQFRASYLVDANGRVTATGPAGGHPHGPAGPEGPGRPPHGAPSRPGGPDQPAPPPPAGCDNRQVAQPAPPPPAADAATTSAARPAVPANSSASN